MHHHQATAEMQRRMNNLIHFGTVIEVDYQKPAFRVRDGKLETGWLPMLQSRNLPQAYCTWGYEINEPVCFLLGADGQGVILGAVANQPLTPGVMTLQAESIRIIGPVEQTGGDMTSDGISAQHHTHGKVAKGLAKTDEPE